MVLDDIWQLLVEHVFLTRPPSSQIATLCNFYLDEDMRFDQPSASKIRKENLASYFNSFVRRPSVLILGEAPGWRGCRFSGIPFTCEAQLVSGRMPFIGKPSSRAGYTSPIREATASIFWNAALPYSNNLFVWNIIPFHPHASGIPMSNRTPSRNEIITWLPFLKELIGKLQPVNIIAVGRLPTQVCNKLGLAADSLRHPAHGGSKEFTVGLESVMNENHHLAEGC